MYSKNRNKQVQCYVCLKIMRSDNLQRHVDSKHADIEKPGVKEKLLIDNKLYYKNFKLENMYLTWLLVEVLSNNRFQSTMRMYALNLYNKMRPIIDVESAELRKLVVVVRMCLHALFI